MQFYTLIQSCDFSNFVFTKKWNILLKLIHNMVNWVKRFLETVCII